MIFIWEGGASQKHDVKIKIVSGQAGHLKHTALIKDWEEDSSILKK